MEKEAYLQKLQAKLNEWDADIEALKAKASGASADARMELNKQIQELESEQNEMKQRYEKLKTASDDAWNDIRHGTEAAWKRASSSFQKAISRFK